MRSRYVAYTRGDIDYIGRTTAPEKPFDAQSARAWVAQATWLGLEVLGTDRGGAGDDAGTVEFVATYRQNGETIAHRERSRFRRTDRGQWRFVDGDPDFSKAADRKVHPALAGKPPPAFAGKAQMAGRNDPCPCGSGKKFKKCCGAA